MYRDLKMGYSFREIIRELCLLQRNKVLIGNINHSKGTIAKIKVVLRMTLRQRVCAKFASVLDCTGKKRPVSEIYDKMTHFSRTGHMQLALTVLMNDRELMTAVCLDNYLTEPDENKFIDIMDAVRCTGDSYYDRDQPQNSSADVAY